jgi:hypothetical protein
VCCIRIETETMLIDMTDITLSNFTTVLSKRAKREAARTKAQENPKQELYLKLSPLPRNKKTSAAAVPSIVSAADPSFVAPSIEVPLTTADPSIVSAGVPFCVAVPSTTVATIVAVLLLVAGIGQISPHSGITNQYVLDYENLESTKRIEVKPIPTCQGRVDLTSVNGCAVISNCLTATLTVPLQFTAGSSQISPDSVLVN